MVISKAADQYTTEHTHNTTTNKPQHDLYTDLFDL